MRRERTRIALHFMVLAVALALPARGAAQDPAFEQSLRDALVAMSPEALTHFDAANDARQRGDFDVAVREYEEVRALAPAFVHATRRECQVELARGNVLMAEPLCRRAVAAEESADNLASLADVLIATNDPAKLPEASALVTQASQLSPDAWRVETTRVDLELARNDLPAVRDAAMRALRSSPAEMRAQIGASIALSIVAGNRDRMPSPAEIALARRLARTAVAIEPNDPYTHVAVGTVALAGDDLVVARSEAGLLAQLDPNGARSQAFVAQVAARSGVGRHDGSYGGYGYGGLTVPHRREPPSDHTSWLGTIAWGLGGWAAGFVVLLLLGALLSTATLRAARELPRSRDGAAVGVSGVLRGAYRLVLLLACAYYYLSIPIVLLSVVGAAGALLYAIFAVGVIPVKLVIIVVVVVGVTVFAVLKALFVRVRDEDPGTKVDLSKEPRLRALLEEVARRVGTRPVDAVYLTPGTEIAVFERGGLLGQLRGRSERCLVLGIGVLDGMQIVELKAILAHEYGHFRNEDTAGGGFALAVRRSLMAMAIALLQGGAAGWHNPAWWFVNGFHRVFLRVSQGASRLQEILADRWAAFAYGPKAFERGLRHVIERSVRFDAHVGTTLREVMERSIPLSNLYAFVPSTVPTERDVEAQISAELSREPSPYDSHPAPADRIAWVRELEPITAPRPDDEDDAWTVFQSRGALEQQMTGEVKMALRLQGISIPAA